MFLPDTVQIQNIPRKFNLNIFVKGFNVLCNYFTPIPIVVVVLVVSSYTGLMLPYPVQTSSPP